jgi:hypothetical protein
VRPNAGWEPGRIVLSRTAPPTRSYKEATHLHHEKAIYPHMKVMHKVRVKS